MCEGRREVVKWLSNLGIESEMGKGRWKVVENVNCPSSFQSRMQVSESGRKTFHQILQESFASGRERQLGERGRKVISIKAKTASKGDACYRGGEIKNSLVEMKAKRDVGEGGGELSESAIELVTYRKVS